MKKFIAIAMSGLLALSSVSVAAVAEPVVPSVNAVTDMAWSQNARPVSAEELAQIRSQLPEKNVMPKDPEDDIHTGYGVITGPLIEAVMSMAQEAAVDSESQVEPPVLAQITASMAVLEYREGYEYRVYHNHWDSGWVASNVFDSLGVGQQYLCQQRLSGRPETESQPLRIRTEDRGPCSIPAVTPIVDVLASTFVELIELEGYEYRIDDGRWQNVGIFRNLEPGTEYTVYQRIKETYAETASEPSELRIKTPIAGPSASTNQAKVAEHIKANGFLDENNIPTLAYSVTIDDNNIYYFVITYRTNSLHANVFNVCEGESFLTFDTYIDMPVSGHMFPTCYMQLVYDDYCVDEVEAMADTVYVEDYRDNALNVYHYGSQYLNDDTISDMVNSTVAMLCGFWDEVLYEDLGFGLRGLGFLSYDGYGELFCSSLADYHTGTMVKANQREPGCVVEGHEGNLYCSVCHAQVTHGSSIPSKGGHKYDHNCDPDCNVCGELRRIQHIYSFACATECDLCGAIRTEPLAEHHFDENRVCTSCGLKLSLIGDVTGDGNVNMGDISKIYAHVKGSVLLTDSDALAIADITGDGNINMGDVSRLAAHVSGRVPLW